MTDTISAATVATLQKYTAQQDAEAATERALSDAIDHIEALSARYGNLIAEKTRLATESGLTTKDLERWTRRIALADNAVERAIEKVDELIAA